VPTNYRAPRRRMGRAFLSLDWPRRSRT